MLESLIYAKSSNGVAAAFICAGQRFLGARGMAAQAGHMSLPPEERPVLQRTMKKELHDWMPDERCPRCERRRCVENVASGQAILKQLRRLQTERAQPSITE